MELGGGGGVGGSFGGSTGLLVKQCAGRKARAAAIHLNEGNVLSNYSRFMAV